MSSASHEGSSVNSFLPMAIRGELSFPQGIPCNLTSGGITIPATVPHDGDGEGAGRAAESSKQGDAADVCLCSRQGARGGASRLSHGVLRSAQWRFTKRATGVSFAA